MTGNDSLYLYWLIMIIVNMFVIMFTHIVHKYIYICIITVCVHLFVANHSEFGNK